MKHLEVHKKYSAARRIFNSLLDDSSSDETLRLILDILQCRNTCIADAQTGREPIKRQGWEGGRELE